MFHDSPDSVGSAAGQPDSPWTGPEGTKDNAAAGGYGLPSGYASQGYGAQAYGPYGGSEAYGGSGGSGGSAGSGGYGGPGGYAMPGHQGTPPPPPPGKRRGVRTLAITAVAALAVGAGSTWALTSATAASS